VAYNGRDTRRMLDGLGQILASSQLSFRWLEMPWARAQLAARDGECLIYGLSHNRQREALFQFSAPVVENRVWLLVPHDAALVPASLQDLKGLRVCLLRGNSHGDAFDDAKGTLFAVENVDGNLLSRVRMLLSGRCDVLVHSSRETDDTALRARLAGLIGEGLASQLRMRPLMVETLHFAAARGSRWVTSLPSIDQALLERRSAVTAWVSQPR